MPPKAAILGNDAALVPSVALVPGMKKALPEVSPRERYEWK